MTESKAGQHCGQNIKSSTLKINFLTLQVFRRKRKLYLVFEYVDHTILGQ